MTCPISLDQQFGPRVATCRRNFDFTLLFEEWVFSLIPSISFMILGLMRLGYLVLNHRRPVVAQKKLQLAKIGVISLLAIVQLALLIIWAKQNSTTTTKTKISVPAASLEFIATLLLGVLSFEEHRLALQASTIVTVYLLFNGLLDIARTRTLWMMSPEQTTAIPALFSIALALRVIALGLEMKRKTEHLSNRYKEYAPEEVSGAIEKAFFWWMNPLLLSGFRQPLQMDTVGPIATCFSSETLGLSSGEAWRRLYDSKGPRSDYALVWALLKTYRLFFLKPILPRLVLLAFTCTQPILLKELINFLSLSQKSDVGTSEGWGIVGAYALVYIGLAASTALYWHQHYRAVTVIRGGLITLVYDKILKLAAAGSTDSKAITLINADIERIVMGMRILHETWASLVQIAIASIILEKQLGVSFLAPIIVSSISGVLTFWVTKSTGGRQVTWLKAIEARVAITTAVLSDLKGVTLSGLSEKFSSLIQGLRVKELSAASDFRWMLVRSVTNAYIPNSFSPILAFGMFIGITASSGNPLDVSKLFTALAAINLVTQPLAMIFSFIPMQVSAIACFTRIQKFLEKESMPNLLLPMAPMKESILSQKNTGDGSIPLENIQVQPEKMDRLPYDKVLEIRSGSFGWAQDGSKILSDIDLTIERGQIHFIIGPVASGKSTLLKSMLGETVQFQGQTIRNFHRVAFGDQTPWLRNATIKENIVGYTKTQDDDWYNTVIKASAFDIDLKPMPKGDQTLVGSKGMSLSGGQKQRLAIARAIYARSDVVILDDVFASLDAKTEHFVYEQLLGPNGILRKAKATVILATNSVQYRFLADRIVMLSQEGKIAENATPEELSRKGINLGVIAEMSSQQDEVNSVDDTESESPTPIEKTVTETDESDKGAGQIRVSGDFSVWKYYFAALGVPAMLYYFSTVSINALFNTIAQIWLKWWTDNPNPNDMHVIGKYLGVYAVFQTAGFLGLFEVIRFSIISMVSRVGSKLHWKILHTVMSAPMAVFQLHDVGTITNRFTQDIQLLDSDLSMAMLNTGVTIFMMIGQIAVTMVPAPYLAISLPFVFGVLYCLQSYYLRTSRQLRILDLEAKAPLLTHLLETVDGLISIRAFAWAGDAIARCRTLLDNSQKPFYLMMCIQRWLTLVLDLTAGGLTVLLVSLSVVLRHSASTGFTAVALVNLMTLNTTMMALIISWTQLETSLGAVARIKAFEEEIVPENALDDTHPTAVDWPRQGEIKFHKLVASYHSSPTAVLKGISFTIGAGEKVALCGRTGSGKSSAVLALARLIPINDGFISVDNVDLASVERNLLRSKLNILPQTPFLIPGTYRLNVDLHEIAPDHEIRAALETVGLWDVIAAAGGLDAELDSSALSHGQKQLFCLARSILRPCPIVVLDEATSSVDYETDRKMQSIIRDKFADKTILCITHRVQTILDFDRVIVLDAGEVVESDSPSALLADEDSIFKSLYDHSGGN